MTTRITELIKQEGMTPSAFADYIGISRASMNHILNGRNNPSLEVVNRILAKFPNINTDWLLLGKLPKSKTEKTILQPDLFAEKPVEPPQVQEEKKYEQEIGVKPPENKPNLPLNQEFKPVLNTSKKINKIMVFYSDNTYESFSSENFTL